ncbi:HEXXH motif-containing putative peptide modification protein [Micromonospora sp. NPDC047074]|uniref:aKG-HExxH-type peptide beta-hydroxylase n=1 Tax=Micromonospora sp. NPDC047074 TaxID=3154339 RepID=UPI0033C7F856
MALPPQPSGGLNPAAFFAEIGGLPFIAPGFRPPILMAAVAAVRHNADPQAFPRLGDYLVPGNAAEIYQRRSRSPIQEIRADDMPPERVTEVLACRARVRELFPEWESLLAVPIRYMSLHDSRISATNILVPQTIYFGESAFRSTAFPLEESLVHEFAHVWLNFVTETFDLETDDSPRDLVLPSGTRGKTLRGVLVAAHFAATATIFYSRYDDTPLARSRSEYLYDYLLGCLRITRDHPSLTRMGRIVWQALDEYSRQPHRRAESEPVPATRSHGVE